MVRHQQSEDLMSNLAMMTAAMTFPVSAQTPVYLDLTVLFTIVTLPAFKHFGNLSLKITQMKIPSQLNKLVDRLVPHQAMFLRLRYRR